mmetsp:Transcript_18649/g.25979  ORF Transcript_18649/g.25979 Transcript_18649/m.25979 type:complete len:428 (-) Transcript_18649:155-1438(-)|eukprot:CAMPEP_0184479240 /NCGR_PEP_ID=MMETSP0113_2-20130426/1043_1 /TAXON_ID=91329 /ORGANISM="Norrisiella sphaerica, Strain BC52" /LENGTH=427 /DNA_ID=CAMNT_0026857277 /DNA_START=455 /DNA_END=1738 /DNA_ORIENTATION=+
MGDCSILSDLCLSEIDHTPWGKLLEVLLMVYSFLGLATICDEYLVVSLEVLCIRWKIREDIAGATFMAFGSAAPEIVVNAVTTLKGQSDTGVGAIIGSGWIAFLLIPGFCALFTDGPLEIKRRPMLRDMMFYALALTLLSIFFHDGSVGPLESCILAATYLAYLCVVWISPILRRKWRERQGEIVMDSRSFVQLAEEEKSFLEMIDVKDEESVQVFVSEILDEIGPDNSLFGRVGRFIEKLACPLIYLFKFTCPPCERKSKYECLYPITFLMSFLWVAVFSFIVSTVVERWAALSGLNSGFFGLFLISSGAEIPDTIQSVTVAKRGYGSMAVANSIGSQIINICLGLGMPWAIHNAFGTPVKIDDHDSLQIAVWFQAGVVCFSFVIFLGSALILRLKKAILNRKKGYALVTAYFLVLGAYATVLFTT